MTKYELIQKIYRSDLSLSSAQSAECVEVFLQFVMDSLRDGNRVELRGFGVFEVRKRSQYKGRNPSTSQEILISPKNVPFFKSSATLNKIINR